MKCTNCGHELSEGSYFCSECGAKVGSSSGQQAGNEYVVQDDNYNGGNGGYRAPKAQAGAANGLAIASLVLGIGALILSCCLTWLGFFMAIAGGIVGAIALYKGQDGRGMAIAGIICSGIALILAIGVTFVSFFLGDMFGYGYYW